MKRMKKSLPFRLAIVALSVGLLSIGTVASADCYADYKAKRDYPLKLHYGIMRINGDCSKSAAIDQVTKRLSSNGWTLLNVLSVFDEAGIDKRKDSAGKFFLRF